MVEALQENNSVTEFRAVEINPDTLSDIDIKVDAFAPLLVLHGSLFTEKAHLQEERVQPPKNAIIAAREFCDAVNRCQSLLQGFEHASYQRLKNDWEESGAKISENYRDQAWWQAGFAVVSAVCVFAPILMTEGNYTSLPFADASLTDADAISTALQAYKSMVSAAGSSIVPSLGQAWEKSYQSPLNLLHQANQDAKGQLDQAKQAEEQFKRLIIEMHQTNTQVMREARQASSNR